MWPLDGFFATANMQLSDLPYERWMAEAIDASVRYLPKVLLALVLLWVGMRLIKLFGRAVDRGLESRAVEPTLRRFVGSLVSIGLKVLLFITAIQMMGVQTTSFVAIIGAAGLAIGLALQGTLANFAGGVLVLLFKPYKVGDRIEVQGVTGKVKEIQIFTTVLVASDSRTIIVPNGAAANGIIINHSEEGRIRVDCLLSIARTADLARAREVLLAVLRANPKVQQDPPPQVFVNRQVGEGLELTVRPYCTSDDFWDVYFDTMERGSQALLQAGIGAPTSEHTVLLKQN